jgi:hypothetical protein
MTKASRRWLFALAVVALLCLPFLYVQITEHPSLDRDWSPDQRVMPKAAIDGDKVTVDKVRNFAYRATDDYTPAYEQRTYDLAKLDSVWFVVEHFGDAPAIAHTFVSFGFGGEYVAISVEIRKERGEVYSPVKGLLRQYELMYVVADERDVIGLRTNFRRDPVYLYPVKSTREQMRRMFLDMVERANRLGVEPEFYNSLTNNCTSNIVAHVNTLAPRSIPFSYKTVFPAYSDKLAYELGLIPADQPFEKVQAAHRIDLIAQRAPVGPDFSKFIRAGIGEFR